MNAAVAVGPTEAQFITAVKLLATTGFDRQRFIKLAAAVPPEAAQRVLASHVMMWPASTPYTAVPQVMAEALWNVIGCEAFVKSYANQASRFVWACEFVLQRLEEHPNEFSDLALSLLYARSDDLAELAGIEVGKRLESVVDQLPDKRQELSADAEQLKQRARDFGFPPELNEALAKIEAGLGIGDGFDQAALLKHLRTFYENLHRGVGEELRRRKPVTIDGTNLGSFGQAIDYLHRKDVVTEPTRALAKALYGMLSNQGVHSLKAEKEYVRLCWNMVIEYGKILLFELERAMATA